MSSTASTVAPVRRGDLFFPVMGVVGVDGLILLAVLRDLIVTGNVHPVFRFGLPMIVAGQFMLAWIRWSPWWLHTAPGLFK